MIKSFNQLLSPYPGRRLSSIDEVDAALKIATKARLISESNFLDELRSFWLDYPPAVGDPWSLEYRNHWWKVYTQLSGKDYAIQNENFDFDVDYHSIYPYPFCTKDYQIVSNQLIGIGMIIKALALPPGSSVLEMGAGWGNTSLFLAQMGYAVTVLDINPKYGILISRRANALNVNIDFVCAGYEDVVSLNKKFNCILFFESFHHSYDHLQLLDLLPAVIAPSGILALSGEPMNENLPYAWGLNPAGEALWQIRNHGWFELVFRESYLVDTLQAKGFLIEKFECKNNPLGTTLVCRLS